MPKKVLTIVCLFAFVLSACGTFEVYVDKTPVGESVIPGVPATDEPKLSLNSSSEEIQRAMLESATQWKSIWMDGIVTHYPAEGISAPPTTFREQVWIDLTTGRFRVLSGPVDGAANQYLSSDGITVLKLDLVTGQSQSQPLPDFAKVGQFVPTLEPGNAYPQPLWGQMGTPLSQLAFTSDFAQNDGTFKPTGVEFIADREALIVEWTYAQSELPSFRMWLDNKTAVILKMQSFDKGGGDTIRSEAVVNDISFDDVFASTLFGIPSSLPQFSDISGQVSETVDTGTAVPGGRDVLGELYFFESPHGPTQDQSIPLVRMPGLCVIGEAECPQLEHVDVPFPLSVGLPTLSWSPDGNFAAMAYPDNPNGTPYKLWLFDPAADTWTSLWEYPYIDPPMWSPDGQWIAFRQQDGLGGEDIMVIHPDGSEPKNLSIGANLPTLSLPYIMDGWITGNVIVRSGKFDTDETIYLVRVVDLHTQPMFKTQLTKAVLIPSHDGTLIAYDDFDLSTLEHSLKVAEPDGANAVELASFASGSLYPIVWSPDNKQVAFVHYTEITQGSQSADVYVIGRDGKVLKQVYQGQTVGSLLFSPDGRYLLINETASSTGGRLFVVNIDTLAQRLIQSPGLNLDSDWFMPSWRK